MKKEKIIKICIFKDKNKTYWKEHGQMAYSNDIWELMVLISENNYEIKFSTDSNKFVNKWNEIPIY